MWQKVGETKSFADLLPPGVIEFLDNTSKFVSTLANAINSLSNIAEKIAKLIIVTDDSVTAVLNAAINELDTTAISAALEIFDTGIYVLSAFDSKNFNKALRYEMLGKYYSLRRTRPVYPEFRFDYNSFVGTIVNSLEDEGDINRPQFNTMEVNMIVYAIATNDLRRFLLLRVLLELAIGNSPKPFLNSLLRTLKILIRESTVLGRTDETIPLAELYNDISDLIVKPIGKLINGVIKLLSPEQQTQPITGTPKVIIQKSGNVLNNKFIPPTKKGTMNINVINSDDVKIAFDNRLYKFTQYNFPLTPKDNNIKYAIMASNASTSIIEDFDADSEYDVLNVNITIRAEVVLEQEKLKFGSNSLNFFLFDVVSIDNVDVVDIIVNVTSFIDLSGLDGVLYVNGVTYETPEIVENGFSAKLRFRNVQLPQENILLAVQIIHRNAVSIPKFATILRQDPSFINTEVLSGNTAVVIPTTSVLATRIGTDPANRYAVYRLVVRTISPAHVYAIVDNNQLLKLDNVSVGNIVTSSLYEKVILLAHRDQPYVFKIIASKNEYTSIDQISSILLDRARQHIIRTIKYDTASVPPDWRKFTLDSIFNVRSLLGAYTAEYSDIIKSLKLSTPTALLLDYIKLIRDRIDKLQLSIQNIADIINNIKSFLLMHEDIYILNIKSAKGIESVKRSLNLAKAPKDLMSAKYVSGVAILSILPIDFLAFGVQGFANNVEPRGSEPSAEEVLQEQLKKIKQSAKDIKNQGKQLKDQMRAIKDQL